MFNPTEYRIVCSMVKMEDVDDLCLHDAIAEYLFPAYDACHEESYDEAIENDHDIDWESINRIDSYIVDRLIQLGREDDWTQGESIFRDITCYTQEASDRYCLRDKVGDLMADVFQLDDATWEACKYDGMDIESQGYGDTPQEALEAMRLVLPME